MAGAAASASCAGPTRLGNRLDRLSFRRLLRRSASARTADFRNAQIEPMRRAPRRSASRSASRCTCRLPTDSIRAAAATLTSSPSWQVQHDPAGSVLASRCRGRDASMCARRSTRANCCRSADGQPVCSPAFDTGQDALVRRGQHLRALDEHGAVELLYRGQVGHRGLSRPSQTEHRSRRRARKRGATRSFSSWRTSPWYTRAATLTTAVSLLQSGHRIARASCCARLPARRCRRFTPAPVRLSRQFASPPRCSRSLNRATGRCDSAQRGARRRCRGVKKPKPPPPPPPGSSPTLPPARHASRRRSIS